MIKNMRFLAIMALSIVFSIPPNLAFGADSNFWKFLPTRVLEIDGGAVSFQSAVIVDSRQRLKNILFQDYPTKYILATTNESDFPIWVDAEWRVPGERPFSSSGYLSKNEHGTFFVLVKEVVWNTPIPVVVTIYADKNKTRRIGEKDVVLLFNEVAEEKSAFLESATKINSTAEKNAIAAGSKKAWIPLLPGFQEMPDISKPVPGTSADIKLTEDIQLLLWRNQSRRHWDCTHRVLGASPYDPKETTKFSNLSDKDKSLIADGQSRGDIAFEEWQVKSCENVSRYLVLMGKSAKGGTSLMAIKIQDGTSPQ